ncbi:methyltransferase domain-containing protein [Colletotrichum graminicola]|uniref:Methyltransferase domain-containing protein n=1 Tax=Colletotrichum graminicola (strain M1.001 / M2 / FGSC 10212) TaxID=645133 RepID=E3QWZ8_COLGM|nr:methyltransferase domain-containing protein [Colletotrichum graminicola M1.001]EFQ35386.1 methyltransferase domain-containing protein [Colletotrichum graminicola M1.001]WDK14965.1 methyltransferase domain-containing protein [Colletotrichum graminicola]
MSLDAYAVLDAFSDIKSRTDQSIAANNLDTYSSEFLPRSEDIAVAIFCNALEELGCPIRSAASGDKLSRVRPAAEHKRLVDYIYRVLEARAGLILDDGNHLTRTSKACPDSDIDSLLDSLLRDRPSQDAEIKLMQTIGKSYGKCLSGEVDAVQLLFDAAESRSLLNKLYATSDATNSLLQPLKTFIEEVAAGWSAPSQPLRILEVGAGTGGTTSVLLPTLARLGVPTVYTMTDISPSLVTQASSAFKQFPFVEFRVVDIEKEPPQELRCSQHIVLGSNVVHTTTNAQSSLKNIHKMLRPDGFLIFHELTMQMPWADVCFGLFEGWWRFDDGRQHALQSPQAWAKMLKSAGYGHADWTDGSRPEAKLQSLILGMASDIE